MAEKLKDIGSILQKARTSRGFTQAEIAPQLGVSRATVAQIETGRRSLKAEDLRRLAAFYGCSPSELLPRATNDEKVDGPAELFRSHPDLTPWWIFFRERGTRRESGGGHARTPPARRKSAQAAAAGRRV